MKQTNQKTKHQKLTNQGLSLMVAVLLIMNTFLSTVNAIEKDKSTSEQANVLTEKVETSEQEAGQAENTIVSEKETQAAKENPTETEDTRAEALPDTQPEAPADSELPSEEGVVPEEDSDIKEQATQTEPIADKAAAQDNAKEINEAIRGLEYDSETILTSKGEEIESKSFPSKEGVHQNDKFVVIERKKKSLTTSPIDISVIGSMLDRTYPGALQLALRSLGRLCCPI
ncbi:hypothetical protein EII17_14245 [Clostridiales bacterium COT073_COT-073]|nr:hypothetical protein EII17_14245 [Clostridiales bacterium COT073_COT-073]